MNNMAQTFKDQFVATLEHNEKFVADLISDCYGNDTDWADFYDLADEIVGAIKAWKFGNRDSFQANLEEFEIADDRTKTALMDAMLEGVDFFIEEILIED